MFHPAERLDPRADAIVSRIEFGPGTVFAFSIGHHDSRHGDNAKNRRPS
jgi:hypothetical protein